jgi:hypothetical protein
MLTRWIASTTWFRNYFGYDAGNGVTVWDMESKSYVIDALADMWW